MSLGDIKFQQYCTGYANNSLEFYRTSLFQLFTEGSALYLRIYLDTIEKFPWYVSFYFVTYNFTFLEMEWN